LPYLLEQGEAHVSASIGIAMFPGDAQDVDRLIIASDVAMYAAKRGGKNTYRFHDRTLCR
jgi:predicted signal transduction protein with EAL and GGDEF domain